MCRPPPPPLPQELQHLEFLAAAGLQSTCGPCHPILCDRPSFAAEYAGFGRWLLQRRQRATELRERRAAAAAGERGAEAPESDLERRVNPTPGEAEGMRWGDHLDSDGDGAAAAAATFSGRMPVEAGIREEPSASTLESIDGWDIGGVEFTDLGIVADGAPAINFSVSGSSSGGSSSQDKGVPGGVARDVGPSSGRYSEQQQQLQQQPLGRESLEGGGRETAHVAEVLLVRADAAAGDSLPLRRGAPPSSSSRQPATGSSAAAARGGSSKSGRPAKPRKKGAGSSGEEGLGFDPDEGWALGGAEGK